MISTELLSSVFVEVADSLVTDFDVVDFLQTLTQRAAAVSGAASVGLMLIDQRGQLRFMAASDEGGKMMELLQLQVSEGPCIDCVREGRPMVNADLAGAGDRWPSFAPAATAAGYQSVHAFPLRLRDEVAGAMCLFGVVDEPFDESEVPVVQALADVATIALIQERTITRSHALTEQLQGALNTRVTIEQAKGALAQLEGTTPGEAFTLMREEARSSRRRLAEVAAEVIERIQSGQRR